MRLTNKHIAMLITFLLSAMVVMAMYLVEIKLKDAQIAESFLTLHHNQSKKKKPPKIRPNPTNNQFGI